VQFSGELAALGTALCWTITALSFEVAGKRIGSLVVNLLRLLIAIALLAAWGALRRGLPWPTDASLDAWLWLSASGVIGFAVGDLCLFRAFVVIGSRLSMLLMSLVPPLTALSGWILLGERLAGRDWLGMALTVGGVAWAVLERPEGSTDPGTDPGIAPGIDPGADSGVDPGSAVGSEPTSDPVSPLPISGGDSQGRSFGVGVLLGLGGALGQAGGLVLSKRGMGAYDAFAATQIRVLAGSVSFILLFTVIGWWGQVRAAFTDRRGLTFTGIGAFFGPFLGVSLSLLAVQATMAGVAATIMSLTPVLIIPVSFVLQRQPVSLRALVAALVAVGGSALLFL
jgi:drug/metabolite transporter (DMT)-like permease